jgi:hypothetical protein
VAAFLEALQRNTNVRKLELDNNNLDDGLLGAIIGALLERTVDIYSLDLSGNTFADQGADALAQFLSKTSSLRALSLAGNRIGDLGAAALAASLPTSLHDVDLSRNLIGDAGAEALLAAISNGAFVRVNTCTRTGSPTHPAPTGSSTGWFSSRACGRCVTWSWTTTKSLTPVPPASRTSSRNPRTTSFASWTCWATP